MWTWFNLMAARIAALFRPRRLDSDFEQEMESHLLLLVEDNLRRGMTPAEARREARMRLGGLESLSDQHREIRSLPFFETLLQDLRYTARTLRRDAGFATFAILIVGLGIGAGSTIFSVVNALLLRPLPLRDPRSLVWISNIPDDARRRRVANPGRPLSRSAKARKFLLRSHGLQQLLWYGRRQTHGRWRGRASHRRAGHGKLFLRFSASNRSSAGRSTPTNANGTARGPSC